MWSPTHSQVTVLRAKGLLIKGKHDTNNCFVTISLGKEKYQTSTKEKAGKDCDWHEECELTIPNQGNRAELVLTCLHRNNLGLDDFLGQIALPLCDMDAYERPRAKWYKLQSKPGQEKKAKDRGEIEVRVAFTVKAGSLTDLSKKDKQTKSSKQNVGGSLLSLGGIEKRKGLKKFAKSLGSKMHINSKEKPSKKDKISDSDSFSGSYSSIGGSMVINSKMSRQTFDDADPGVISENEDEFTFDNLSHKSSGNSLNVKSSSSVFLNTQFSALEEEHPVIEEDSFETQKPPPKPDRAINTKPELDEWDAKLYAGSSDSLKRRSWDTRVVVPHKTNPELNDALEADAGLVMSSSTAPNTPTLNDKKQSALLYHEIQNEEKDNQSKTLPRSLTLESIHEKEDKKSESKNILKKLKFLRRDKSNENILAATNGLSYASKMEERIIIGHENDMRRSKNVEVPQEVLKKYEGKSREEIIKIAHNLESEVRSEKMKIKEMEDYLDDLLLRVMETHPRILQNPYQKMGQMSKR